MLDEATIAQAERNMLTIADDPEAAADALRDIGLVVKLFLCNGFGFPIARATERNVRARWAIWRAGYGVYGFKPGKASLGKFTVYRHP